MEKPTDHKVLREKSEASWAYAEKWSISTIQDLDSAASRCYYSALQSVIAYAVRTKCREWLKYEDNVSGASIHLVMRQVVNGISPNLKRTMMDLFDIRREADYRSSHVEREQLDEALANARKVIEAFSNDAA